MTLSAQRRPAARVGRFCCAFFSWKTVWIGSLACDARFFWMPRLSGASGERTDGAWCDGGGDAAAPRSERAGVNLATEAASEGGYERLGAFARETALEMRR